MKQILTLLSLFLTTLLTTNNQMQAQTCVGTATLNVTINNCNTLVKVTAFLEGPFNTGSNQMQTGLNFQPLIPTTQPYNTAPWNYAGTESYTGTLPTTVIDWVLVELMNIVNNDNFTVQGRKAALLLSNGKIVDPTWTTNNAIDGVLFDGAFTGQTLSVAVRHRNHLAIVSANPVALPNATTVDLSIANNVMGGSAQLKLLGSEYCMLAGDYDANGTITVADFNGYATESSGINNYFKADFNLDKNVTVADFNLYKPNSSKIGVKPIRY